MLVLAGVTVIAVTGCTASQASVMPMGPTVSESPSPGPAHFGETDVVVPPEVSSDGAAVAVNGAVEALTAFARPGLGYDEWWAGVLSRLSEQAGVAYEMTDPSLIPVHTITGPGTVHAGSTELSLIVQIPTDDGVYNVTMTRSSPDGPWLADRIRPTQD